MGTTALPTMDVSGLGDEEPLQKMDIPATPEFLFVMNKRAYVLPLAAAGALSKRVAVLANSFNRYAEIRRPLHTETVKQFVAALSGREFEVHPETVLELRELADEWGVTGLREHIDRWCVFNKLQPRGDDPLGDLIKHQEGRPESGESKEAKDALSLWLTRNDGLIATCAGEINRCLEDERFEQLTADLAFRIVAAAPRDEVNQQYLADFVYLLTRKRRAADAAPLLLLLDFDRLSPQQKDRLRVEEEIHETNIGFFICQSLSLDREEGAAGRKMLDLELDAALSQQSEELHRWQEREYERRKEEYSASLREVQVRVEDAGRELKEGQESAARLAEEIKVHGNDLVRRFEEIDRKLGDLAGVWGRGEPEDGGARAEEEVRTQLAQLEELSQRQHREQSSKRGGVERKLAGVEKMVQTLRGLLVSKIAQDRLRGDHWERDMSSVSRVGERLAPPWNVPAPVLGVTGKVVESVEQRLKDACPLRVGTSGPA